MRYFINAACGCHMGKVRKNNEDNFSFGGKFLDAENSGQETPLRIRQYCHSGWTVAVFDGMGGENYGELAAYAAAKQMAEKKRWGKSWRRPVRDCLEGMADELNQAVNCAKARMCTSTMGTTMVSLTFADGYIYLCNVGDSRAYWFHDGTLTQLSRDHVSSRPRRPGGKAPLTQCLGIDPEDMVIEPYITRKAYISGEWYLLCSDGLTDMLDDGQIAGIMRSFGKPEACVRQLIQAALDRGGRDNITAIVCKLD